jgi:tetratricopeptide (TPR) repeat protein
MGIRALISILMIVGCTASLFGQGGQPNPEEQMTVRVTYNDDRTASANLRVELLSAYGSSIDTRTTDGFGSVVFTHLRPAKYKLRVSGDGVITTETGELDLTESGPNSTEYVSVRRAPSDQVANGAVSFADVNVPADAKKEFEKGTDSMEKKNWPDAKEHLSRAVTMYPKYALAYNNLGVTYLRMGQGPQAMDAFRNAVQYDEHLAQANLFLGQFYYENKDYKQAEPCLKRAVDAEPHNAQVLLALANTELRNGETEQALANAQKVHSLPDHKKFAIAHLVAAEILSGRGDTQKVGEEYRLFLKEDPSSPLAARVKGALAKLEAPPGK